MTMTMNLCVLVLMYCCIAQCLGAHKRYDGYQLLAFDVKSSDDVTLIRGLRDTFSELDFWTEPLPGVETTVLIPPGMAPRVESRAWDGGLDYRVVSRDVQGIVDASYARTPQLLSLLRRELTGDVIDHTNYHPLDEIRKSLNRLKDAYPDNVRVLDIGRRTHEGRRLMLVKIQSSNTDSTPDKPAIVIEAGIHAREWISPAACLYFVEKLVKDYNNDDVTARQMLDTFDWYLLPVANPDGYQYTWDQDRFWRKNRRTFGNKTCVGVDLNRNFGFHFGETGNSKNCYSYEYPGERAFSERETQAINTFLRGLKHLAAYINVHSYGQILLVPWAWDGMRSLYDKELDRVGKKMQKAMFDTHGKTYTFGTVVETVGYNASGCSMDWAQVTAPGAYTFSLELRPGGKEGGGFHLSQDQIVPQGEEFFAAMAAMAGAITVD